MKATKINFLCGHIVQKKVPKMEAWNYSITNNAQEVVSGAKHFWVKLGCKCTLSKKTIVPSAQSFQGICV